MAHQNPRREAHEHKRGVASPRLVKLLGADARLAGNDEPEFSEEEKTAADLHLSLNKAVRFHEGNDRAAIEAQVLNLDAMRRAGW